MNLGLCTISNRDRSVGDVVDAAAAAGYDGVEVWGGADHTGDGSPDRCASIRETVEDAGIKLPTYGSYLRAGRDGFRERMEHELAVARALGAPRIRVWAGDTDYAERTTEEWHAAVSDLRTLCRRAETLGLAVVVEKHPNTLTDSATGARRLLAAVDAGNCGLNWQPRFDRSGEALLADVGELAPFVDYVHLQALPEPETKPRCLLEDAYFDCGAIVGVLATAGYDGWLSVEFVTPDLPFETAIERDRRYLSSLLDRSPAP